jgi:hypothetical protein
MKDTDTASNNWFFLSSGFKVQVCCPACQSHNVSYYCNRVPGLKGISQSSRGFIPACLDCGKNLPSQREKTAKAGQIIKKKFRST